MLDCSYVRILQGCKVVATFLAFTYFHPTCSTIYFSTLSVGGEKKSLLGTQPQVDFLCLVAKFAPILMPK